MMISSAKNTNRAEYDLHASLKSILSEPDDRIEVPVEGYYIDIVRGDLLIEIQTGNFQKLRKKLNDLLSNHPIRIVYPVVVTKWIKRLDQKSGKILSCRKSPKRGRTEDVFDHLVYLVDFISHENLSIEIIYVQEETILINDGKGSWRRKGWSIFDRKFLAKNDDHILLEKTACYSRFIPAEISQPFTAKDISQRRNMRTRLSQKMLYCMYKFGVLRRVGKLRNAWLYESI